MLMLKAAGVDFEKSISEMDDATAHQAMTTISELTLMVRDNRSTTTDPQAAELYAEYILNQNDG